MKRLVEVGGGFAEEGGGEVGEVLRGVAFPPAMIGGECFEGCVEGALHGVVDAELDLDFFREPQGKGDAGGIRITQGFL